MQASLKVQKPARPLLAITLVVGSVYTILTLITYSTTDPSWNYATSDISSISNWGGVVGSWLSDTFIHSLGISAYLITFYAFYMGIRCLKSRTTVLTELNRNIKKTKWQQPLGIFISVVSLSGLLSLLPFKIYEGIPFGGAIGSLAASAAVFCFSAIGASLLFLGGLWSSLVLITGEAVFFNFKTPPQQPLFKKLIAPFHYFLNKLESFKKPSLFERKERAVPLYKKLSNLLKKNATQIVINETVVHETEEDEEEFEDEENVIEPVKKIEKEGDSLFSLFKKPKRQTEGSDRVLLMDQAPIRSRSQKTNPNYELPSLQLLDLPESQEVEISKDELLASSKALEQKLMDFGIQGKVSNILPGPIITRYEYEPAPGVKVKNIINLTDDLKLAMKAISIRIIAPIPGQAAVGIEIPNPRRQTVYLREILQSPLFQNSRSTLTLGMGKTTGGEPYMTDLSKMPHLLIAGATGSGKSVGLNCLIISMLYKASPDELKMIMIDPKMLELSLYDGIPHLLLPVVTDPKKAARSLQWAVKEMERRYKLISSLGARSLRSFNDKVGRLSEEELQQEVEKAALEEEKTNSIIEEIEDNEQSKKELALKEAGLDHYVKLPHIVIVIDELADLIMVAARDVEESIARLAQMARAAGIHLIIATQRPSVDVITGVIKANLPTRCAFQVASKVDSRTIIDTNGAENLIGDGDMLFLPPGTSRLERLHGPFISEDEIEQVVRHLKTQGQADYNTNINLEESSRQNTEGGDDIDDALYDQALTVIFETKSPSASMLQRRLRVGYNRAARLIERMEREGIVSAPQGAGKGRELLITPSHDD